MINHIQLAFKNIWKAVFNGFNNIETSCYLDYKMLILKPFIS
jgi:hypothetical protein